MLKWPSRELVQNALEAWVAETVKLKKSDGLLRLVAFGSFVRGEWGVGSDLDLVAIVQKCSQPFERRASLWDTLALPVSVDLLVYTLDEWAQLPSARFKSEIESGRVLYQAN